MRVKWKVHHFDNTECECEHRGEVAGVTSRDSCGNKFIVWDFADKKFVYVPVNECERVRE